MSKGALGKVYQDGEIIVRQGDVGESMYVVQQGKVEVLREKGGSEVRLAVLNEGDFFGEMSIFEREVRSATVRAMGETRVLSVDKKTLMRRIHEDPSLAFNMLETLSHRLRELNEQMARVQTHFEMLAQHLNPGT